MITRQNNNRVRQRKPHPIIVLYHIKRSNGTKRSQNTISYHLERLNGTECHMLNGFVPLIRSNRTSRNAKTILYHPKRSIGTKYRVKLILYYLKRFRRTKPEQIVVRISQHIRTTIPAIVTHPQPHP